MIQRDGSHADAHIGGTTKLRLWQVVANLELLQPAVRGDRECSHDVECIFSRQMTSIKVPPLGESIVEATVSKWLKSEGDAVAPGDTLVELETDKITVEVPSVTGGVLKKRFVQEGDVVKLDQPLADVDESVQATAKKGDGQKPAESKAPAKAGA